MPDAAKVTEILLYCLFDEGEPQTPSVISPGVVSIFHFHPERLAARHTEIAEQLRDLPEEFHSEGGPFEGACLTRGGELWGEHHHIEGLICLGIAAGLASYFTPRDQWLAGELPRFRVHPAMAS